MLRSRRNPSAFPALQRLLAALICLLLAGPGHAAVLTAEDGRDKTIDSIAHALVQPATGITHADEDGDPDPLHVAPSPHAAPRAASGIPLAPTAPAAPHRARPYLSRAPPSA